MLHQGTHLTSGHGLTAPDSLNQKLPGSPISLTLGQNMHSILRG